MTEYSVPAPVLLRRHLWRDNLDEKGAPIRLRRGGMIVWAGIIFKVIDAGSDG